MSKQQTISCTTQYNALFQPDWKRERNKGIFDEEET